MEKLFKIVKDSKKSLREKSKPVLLPLSDEIKNLGLDMLNYLKLSQDENFLKAHPNVRSGVGLAAPQVGRTIRLIVLDVSENKDNLITLINPEIIATSDEWICGEEGCLSLPGIWEKVERHAQVTVRYTDLNGQSQTIEADGLLSVCLQHEMDHLDGKVFVDHLSRLKYDRACVKLKKRRLQEKHRN